MQLAVESTPKREPLVSYPGESLLIYPWMHDTLKGTNPAKYVYSFVLTAMLSENDWVETTDEEAAFQMGLSVEVVAYVFETLVDYGHMKCEFVQVDGKEIRRCQAILPPAELNYFDYRPASLLGRRG